MELVLPELCCSTRGLASRVGGGAASLKWISESDVRAVSLDVTEESFRPRLLDRPGRRELAATLKRLDVRALCADVLIPMEHFEGGATAERAVAAVVGAIGLMSELRGLGASCAKPTVCVSLSDRPVDGVLDSIGAVSEREGVSVASLAGEGSSVLGVAVELGSLGRAGVDAATRIAELGDRLCAVRVDRFDRRTLSLVPTSVASMSVGAPGAVGVLDVTDSADARRAVAASVEVWRGPLFGES